MQKSLSSICVKESVLSEISSLLMRLGESQGDFLPRQCSDNIAHNLPLTHTANMWAEGCLINEVTFGCFSFSTC